MQHGLKLICQNLIEFDSDSKFKCTFESTGAIQQPTSFGRKRGIKVIQWTSITPSSFVRCIGAQPRIAEFVPSQGPVNEESQRGAFGPLAAPSVLSLKFVYTCAPS